jgi:NADPH2:quinone reductase
MVVDKPGPPDVLHPQEKPEPSPGEGEVAVEVDYAGVGFVDTLFRAGEFPLSAPFVPGLEISGRIRHIGAGVTGFHVGQPVAALLNDFGRGSIAGGYAETAVARADLVTALPDGLDAAVAAALVVNGVTAWLALHRLARLQVSDTVLVLGATGGLGSLAARLAAVHPARRVIGVVGSEARRSAAPSACTDVLTADGLVAGIEAVTAGRGVDIVIDPVGGRLRAEAMAGLAPFGRLVVLGNASGEDPVLSGDALWHASGQILGLSLGRVAHVIADEARDAMSAVLRLAARGLLGDLTPEIRPLGEAAEVHRALEGRKAPHKTVLAVSERAGAS